MSFKEYQEENYDNNKDFNKDFNQDVIFIVKEGDMNLVYFSNYEIDALNYIQERFEILNESILNFSRSLYMERNENVFTILEKDFNLGLSNCSRTINSFEIIRLER